MANQFPYVSSPGPLLKTLNHLRNSFPDEVSADTLKKLGLAPNNESYIINVLRFLELIDEEGKKIKENAKGFLNHDSEAFQRDVGKLVEGAYSELFELHSAQTWDLDVDALTQFFRTSDNTSAVVGKRQASTFSYLSGVAGHRELPATRETASRKPDSGKKADRGTTKKKTAKSNKNATTGGAGAGEQPNVGLTVRIEVNLPAEGDQLTYDRIFQSIRKNLIDVG